MSPKDGCYDAGREPGNENGVLGLYLGKFPQPPDKTTGSETSWDEETKPSLKNTNGWAWWAGTSFATPILTGAIAAVLSSPAGISTTQAAVQKLYTEGIIQDDQTDAKEDAMLVTQA
jgi:subtilisin family serine protease